jgi:hypothetical protein
MEAQVEADWEVEIGGGAPVIEALWPGFIDLRCDPEHAKEIVSEVAEAAAFPPLCALLLALNAPESSVWTSKCDLWEPDQNALAIYMDMLPRQEVVFAEWQQAEAFCREHVARLAAISAPERGLECSINLVIRQAIAGPAEGFGFTAYLSARGLDKAEAAAGLAAVIAGFADALRIVKPPARADSKLQ